VFQFLFSAQCTSKFQVFDRLVLKYYLDVIPPRQNLHDITQFGIFKTEYSLDPGYFIEYINRMDLNLRFTSCNDRLFVRIELLFLPGIFQFDTAFNQSTVPCIIIWVSTYIKLCPQNCNLLVLSHYLKFCAWISY